MTHTNPFRGRLRQAILLLAFAAIATACGGGGGSGSALPQFPALRPKLDFIRITQNGLVMRQKPVGPLIAGKRTLVVASLKLNGADEAWLKVIRVSDNVQMGSRVRGYAFLPDGKTRLTVIPQDWGVHFFVPGSKLQPGEEYRFVSVLTAGGTEYEQTLEKVQTRTNRGISLALMEMHDGVNIGALLNALLHTNRIFPVNDEIGPLHHRGTTRVMNDGLRFQQHQGNWVPSQALPWPYALDFEHYWLLEDVRIGIAHESNGDPACARGPGQLLAGTSLAFNEWYGEDRDGNGMIDGDDLVCLAPRNIYSQSVRTRRQNFESWMLFLNSLNRDVTGLGERPEFALMLASAGPNAQLRSQLLPDIEIAGLGPNAGRGHPRSGWAAIMEGSEPHYAPMVWALGRQLGLQTATTSPPFVLGPAYDLLNKEVVFEPRHAMSRARNVTLENAFLSDDEWDLAADLLDDTPIFTTPQYALAVTGLELNASVQITSLRLTQTGDANPIPVPPPLTTGVLGARLYDSEGRLLGEYALAESDPGQGGAGDPQGAAELYFEGLLPATADVSRIEILRDGRLLGVRARSPRAPVLDLIGAPVVRDESLQLAWAASDPDGDLLDYDVLLVGPDEHVRPLALGLRQKEVEIPLRFVAGVPGAALRLAASDGFRTREIDVALPELPGHAPAVVILEPRDGSSVSEGGVVSLVAAGLDVEDGPIAPDAFVWSSDLDGELGTGRDLLVRLKRGDHVITVRVRDASGMVSTAKLSITQR